ncbi:hypothetical protein GGI15_003866 [Coemansia interrupta]|uniref:Uncharacterized protein n=1 Tax=Coemansia interrupta TaxID=1126814 RepID=A0A9W8HAP7_9FUNG|nr:hypothetical protein GGI15_003866 [Coemansia interrupta]
MYTASVADARGWPSIGRQLRFLQRLSISRSWRTAAQQRIGRSLVIEQRPGSSTPWHTNLTLAPQAATARDVYIIARNAQDLDAAAAIRAASGLARKKRKGAAAAAVVVARQLHVSLLSVRVSEETDMAHVDYRVLLGLPWATKMQVAELALDCRVPGALGAVEACGETLRVLRLVQVPGHLAGHISRHWPRTFAMLKDLDLGFSEPMDGPASHIADDLVLSESPTGLPSLRRLSVRQCPADQLGKLLFSLAPPSQPQQRKHQQQHRYHQQQEQQKQQRGQGRLAHVRLELGWHSAGVSEMLEWLGAQRGTIESLDVSCIGSYTMHSPGPIADTALTGILQASSKANHLRVALSCWPHTISALQPALSLHGLRTLDLTVCVTLRVVREILASAPGLWQLRAMHVATTMASLEESAVARGTWSWSLECLMLAFDGCQVGREVLGAVALGTAERMPALRVLVLDPHVADAIRRVAGGRCPASVRRLAIQDRPAKW